MAEARSFPPLPHWLNRYDVIAVVIGGLLGWLWAGSYVEVLFINHIGSAVLYRWLGSNAALWMHLYNIVGAATIAFVLARVLRHLIGQHLANKDLVSHPDLKYQLPVWNKPKSAFSLILGEQHRPNGDFIPQPSWYRLPERGLFGNLIAFGGIGSGKTAAVAYPILRQMLEYRRMSGQHRMGGLILDVKGDFAGKARELTEEFDRSDDLLALRVGGEVRWNPIHQPELEPEVLASRLLAVYQNITEDSGSGEYAWVQQGVQRLLTHAIGLLRLSQGYVTLNEVGQFVSRVSSGTPKSLRPNIEKALDEQGLLYQEMGQSDDDQWQYHREFFIADWPNQNDRSRAIVLNGARNLLGLFEQPDIRHTFCPAEDEITFPGFDTVTDEGLMVVLDMPQSRYGPLATAVGTLAKLEFQRAALARVARAAKDREVNTARNLFFFCDEYQNFVSVGGTQGEGDDNFYALSRQSRCISVVLTQSPISLIAKIGEEKARVILASIRTKLFLALVDPQDAKLAADICGEDWQTVESVSFSEGLKDATWNPIDSSMSGKEIRVSETHQQVQQKTYLVEPITLTQLRTFETIISGFDGIKQLAPSKVYLKPDFVPKPLQKQYADSREVPFNVMMKTLENES